MPSLHVHKLFVRNGAVIYSVGGEEKIRSVQLDPASILGSSGFGASNITFDARGVAVDWSGLSFEQGDTVILDVSRAAGATLTAPIAPSASVAHAARTASAHATTGSTPPRR